MCGGRVALSRRVFLSLLGREYSCSPVEPDECPYSFDISSSLFLPRLLPCHFHVANIVRSLKVRIITELTKAPNFAQLYIAYCCTTNIRRGAQCRYATEACYKPGFNFCKFDRAGSLWCLVWKLLFNTLNQYQYPSRVVNNNFTRTSSILIYYNLIDCKNKLILLCLWSWFTVRPHFHKSFLRWPRLCFRTCKNSASGVLFSLSNVF